jgi:hypothetical protein
VRAVDLLAAGVLALWGAPPVPPAVAPAEAVPTPAPVVTPPTPPPAPTGHHLASPSRHIDVYVRAAPDLAYDVLYDGRPLLTDARLSLDVEHRRLGVGARIV